jgi:N-acetylmuramoyl-L-alanine amidase
MRDQLAAAGLQPWTYMGSKGLYGRADLTGLNVAQYPSVLVECGNMKNAGVPGQHLSRNAQAGTGSCAPRKRDATRRTTPAWVPSGSATTSAPDARSRS